MGQQGPWVGWWGHRCTLQSTGGLTRVVGGLAGKPWVALKSMGWLVEAQSHGACCDWGLLWESVCYRMQADKEVLQSTESLGSRSLQ